MSAYSQGVVNRCCAGLRAALLCDASGMRVDSLTSGLFEPEKAVVFMSFSTSFMYYSIHNCGKFLTKYRKK